MIKKYWQLVLSILVLIAVSFNLGVQTQRAFWTPKPVDHVIYLWLPSGYTIA